jgi:NADH-quinone oxidoreductase subunit L
MVAAGVYLVGRLFPLFAHSVEATTTVAIIGGFTAIFAASMGLVANDIKRVLAYSTISQLGYMMLALGVGGYVAGIFHLFNHAFFKALLFLGSGSVNHTTGTFDMRYMGGLRKVMPITFWTFVIASLSLAGIFPFSGFWSKDEILTEAFHNNFWLFLLGIVAAFMTAFYIFRAIFMTFGGEYRGGATAEAEENGSGDAHDSAHGDDHHALHESPWVMSLPLIILAVPAVVTGFLNPPAFLDFIGVPVHWMSEFLEAPLPIHETLSGQHAPGFDFGLAGLSTVVAVSGILLAYAIYSAKWLSANSLGRLFGPIYTLVYRKYYFDELYEDVIVRGVLYRGLSGALATFDRVVIDAAVDGVAWLARGAGGVLRQIETGQVQAYGLVSFMGVLVITALFIIFGGS